jgi:integrase
MGKLTALAIARASKPGLYGDGLGLYLQVGPGGGRSWIYRFGLNGSQRYLGLGPVNAIPLKRARELAAQARQLRAEGIDPIKRRRDNRLAERIANAKTVTFAQCSVQYILAHEATWGNARHRQQWHNTLATYVLPIFGHLPVQAIDTPLVLRVIEPIWKTKPETASRVRGRIELILDWATARELRQGENPARWRGHLQHLLPAKAKVVRVEHHAALPYAEIGAFIAALQQRQGIGARCLEFTILTAARTIEAVNARWDEFDLDAATRVIPGSRMKGGLEHRVPLVQRVVSLLRDLQRHRSGEFVFDGMRIGRPLSHMTMLKLLAVMGHRDLTVHGFRSTFTDWAHETTDFPDAAIDMALAHKVSDKVQAAYRRGALFEKRRKLMETWARFCGGSGDAGA